MSLSFMRRHRRWLYGFLWLVILAFVILYIPAFRDAGSSPSTAVLGRVGDRTITIGEFQQAYRERLELYRSLYQGRLDTRALEQMGLSEQVFEQLVNQRLVELEAERIGIGVDDTTLSKAILGTPQFQREGRFVGGEEVKRLLEQQGLKVADVERSLRGDLLQQKLLSAVTASVDVTPEEIEREFRRRNEQVKLEYVLVDAAAFKAGINPSQAEVEQLFNSARETYRIPEKRTLSYLLLDFETVRARESASDGEIETEYNATLDQFREEAQACASHVLVKIKSETSAEGHPESEARKLAETALAELRAGADFASVARKSSEDKGSVASGGDLGCFPRGAMVPEFETVAFALAPGQMSEIVRSSYGFHVIRLDSRKDEGVAPLASVKERVRQTLIARKAQDRLTKLAEQIGAHLSSGKSLEDAGKPSGLTVQKSAEFSRSEPPAALASPLLAARAFAMSAKQTHPEPFGTPRGAAFVRLEEVTPSRLPELKGVEARVKLDLVERQALALAREKAKDLRARADKDGLEKAAASLGLTRKETPTAVSPGNPIGDLGASESLDDAVYALGEKALSEPLRAASGFTVARVLEKKTAAPEAFGSQQGALRSALLRARREQLFEAFLRQSRERYPVTRDLEAYRRLVG